MCRKGTVMLSQWIEERVVQRVSLHEGLVLNLDDYNELVISRPLRLTLPATGQFPDEEIVIDPDDVPAHERAMLNLSGSLCRRACCDDDGSLHLEFSTGHRIDVSPDDHRCAWELYGKRHGYMACLPHGQVRVVRHDVPDPEGTVQTPAQMR